MARSEAVKKGLFYPTEQTHLDLIVSAFKPYENELAAPAYFLDFSAGDGRTGLAFQKLGLTPLLVELDQQRALICQALFGSDYALNDDGLSFRMSGGSAIVVLTNPPYNDDPTDKHKSRTELTFIRRGHQFVADDGWQIGIVYAHRLSQDLLYSFGRYTDRVDIYRMPGLHLGRYMQVAVFAHYSEEPMSSPDTWAMRMAKRAELNAQMALKARSGERPTDEELEQAFPRLDKIEQGQYELPAPPTIRHFYFMPNHIPPRQLLAIARSHGPHHLKQAQQAFVYQPYAPRFNPVIVPNKDQLINSISAGMFDNVQLTLDGKRMFVRSVIRREQRPAETETEYNEDGTVTDKTRIRIVPVPHITTLDEFGNIQDISSDDALVEFIKNTADELLNKAASRFNPKYTFNFVTGDLKSYLDHVRLSKWGKVNRLLTTQKHVIAAMYKVLSEERAITLVGEQGSGKTAITLTLMDAMRPRKEGDPHYGAYIHIPEKERMRPDQINVLAVPPHLTGKWANEEIPALFPDALVREISAGDNAITEISDFFREIDQALADPNPAVRDEMAYRLKIMVISETMMKMGEGWESAAQFVTRRDKNGPLYEKVIDPTTGFDVVEYVTKKGEIRLTPYNSTRFHQYYLREGKNRDRVQRGVKKVPYVAPEHLIEKTEGYTPEEFNQQVAMLKRFKRYTDEVAMRVAREQNERQKRIARAEISRKREAHEIACVPPYAIWQEVRTSSEGSVDKREDLRQRLGLPERKVTMPTRFSSRSDKKRFDTERIPKYPIMPLPDVVLKATGSYDTYRPKGNPRPITGIAPYMQRRFPGRIYIFAMDEVHQYKGKSGRGVAAMRMASLAQKVIGLTGSLHGGKASTVYRLEFMLNAKTREVYPWDSEGLKAWAEDMGATEVYMTETYSDDARLTKKGSWTTEPKEAPGTSPLLYGWLADHTLFVNLYDMGKDLPPYNEHAIPVRMDALMMSAFSNLTNILNGYMAKVKKKGLAQSFVGAYFNTLKDWPNSPYTDLNIVHNYRKREPDGTWKDHSELVTTFPGLGEDYVSQKEIRLVELVKEKLAKGSGVAVFVHQSAEDNDRAILDRIYRRILDIPGANPVILTSKVSTKRRDQWFKKHDDKNVLICNARLVETGVDLLKYRTIIWYESSVNLYTVEQASRRAWRLNQDYPCDTYFMYYTHPDLSTMESRVTYLIGRKQAAANFLYGRGDGALSDLTSEINIMREALSMVDVDIEDANAIFTREAEMASDWIANAETVEEDEQLEAETPEPELVEEKAIGVVVEAVEDEDAAPELEALPETTEQESEPEPKPEPAKANSNGRKVENGSPVGKQLGFFDLGDPGMTAAWAELLGKKEGVGV